MTTPRPPYFESIARLNAMAAPANERWREHVRESGGDPDVEQAIIVFLARSEKRERE